DDTVVIYVDSIPGAGFGTTMMMTDNADGGRAGASGMGTDGSRATLVFAPDFAADYAIVVRNDSASLFMLAAGGSHTFVRALTRAPALTFDTACVKELGGITMADLGSQAGNPLHWMATLLNASNGFRSNELQGVANASVPGTNPGSGSTLTLVSGDY